MTASSKRLMFGATGTVVACSLAVAFANGQAGQEPRPQMSDAVFKNVTVLKGIPVDEFMDTMGMFSAALSLNCTDCHTPDSTSSWDQFAADTELKRTARRMVLMMNGINASNFRGARNVTCWTCHRGDQRPKVAPSLMVQYGTPIEDPNEVVLTGRDRNSRGPTVDQVFDKYIRAIGGAQRVANVTSIVGKGTYVGYDTDHEKVPVDVYAKATAQRTVVVHMRIGDSTRTYDGRAGWVASPDKPFPLIPLTGGNLEGAKLEATLLFPTRIKQLYSQWRVGETAVDDKPVQVLQSAVFGQPPLSLYFDQATGLLVRVVRFAETAVGRVPTQYDFSVYREVSGIKVPFKTITTWTDGQATTELTLVQTNATIDAARFNRPAPAPPPKLQ